MTDSEANKLLDEYLESKSTDWKNVDICILGHILHIANIKFHENKIP